MIRQHTRMAGLRTMMLALACMAMALLWCSHVAWADEDRDDARRPAAEDRQRQVDRSEHIERFREWRERRAEADPNFRRDRDMPDRPAFRDEGRPDRHQPIDRERARQLLDVLSDINPDLHSKLTEALGDNPERARMVLGRMNDRLGWLVKMKTNDPNHYQLRARDMRYTVDAMKLAMRIRHARHEGEDERIDKLTRELRSMVDQHFELRQELRERELHQLEQRIDHLREELAEHRRRKAELVDEHIHRLLHGGPPDHRGDRDARE